MSTKAVRRIADALMPSRNKYPHVEKIQRNLHLVLAIAEATDGIEGILDSKKEIAGKQGFIDLYPDPYKTVKNYNHLLEELLIETAVFIRGHNSFWEEKENAGLFKILKRECGDMQFLDEDPQIMKIDLKIACDKIVHHTSSTMASNQGDKFLFTLFGKLGDRRWSATLDVKEFCFIGLTYVR